MEIVTIHYNEEPCTFVSSDAETNTFNYTFTMPASDVTLNIEVREMARPSIRFTTTTPTPSTS